MSRLAEILAEYNRQSERLLGPLRFGRLETMWLSLVARINPEAYTTMLEALWIPAAAEESRDILFSLGDYHIIRSDRKWEWVAKLEDFDVALGLASDHKLYFIGHKTEGADEATWVVARKDTESGVEEEVKFTLGGKVSGGKFLRDLEYHNDTFPGGYHNESSSQGLAADLVEDLFLQATKLQAS